MVEQKNSGIRPPLRRTGETTLSAEHQLQFRRLELGVLGYVFGSKDNAPFFIAGIIVILSFIGIFIALLSSNTGSGDTLKALFSLIFAALSFIGGYSGRRDRR
jgi:hypothetical protein